MISLRDADAKAKARDYKKESPRVAIDLRSHDRYNPAAGTRWYWQANPKFRILNLLQPQPNPAMLQELALYEANKGPWPPWYIPWNSQSNDWNWGRNWRRDKGESAPTVTITAKKTGESDVPKKTEPSKKRALQTSVVGIGKVDIQPTSGKVVKPETSFKLRRSPRIRTTVEEDGILCNFESSSSDEEDAGAKRRKL